MMDIDQQTEEKFETLKLLSILSPTQTLQIGDTINPSIISETKKGERLWNLG